MTHVRVALLTLTLPLALPVLAQWHTYHLADELDDAKVTYACRTNDETENVILYVMRSTDTEYDSENFAYVYVAPQPMALDYIAGAEVGGYLYSRTYVPFRWRVDKGEVHDVEGDERDRGFTFMISRDGLQEWIDGTRLIVRYNAPLHQDDINVRFPLAGAGKAIRWVLSQVATKEHAQDPETEADASSGPFLAGTGGVTLPTRIEESYVSPVYPEDARVRGVEGRVIMQAVIRSDGTVDQIEILNCNTPNMGFEEAAILAVRQWRYEPAERNGIAVDVYFTMRVDFDME